jgi:type I restriction enzyme M protein
VSTIVNGDQSVAAAHARFLGMLEVWWQAHLPHIKALAPEDGEKGNVYELRRLLMGSIEAALADQMLLTDHQVRGALARYFEFFKPELKSIAFSGWGPELIPDEDILESQFPEILAEIQTKGRRLAELTALFSAADEEDYEDEDDTGVLPGDQVKTLREELKVLNTTWKTALKELKALATDLFTEMKTADVLPSGVKKSDVTPALTHNISQRCRYARVEVNATLLRPVMSLL